MGLAGAGVKYSLVRRKALHSKAIFVIMSDRANRFDALRAAAWRLGVSERDILENEEEQDGKEKSGLG